jgi:hypothetical protein
VCSEHVDTAAAHSNLGVVQRALGEYRAAQATLEEALRIKLKVRRALSGNGPAVSGNGLVVSGNGA